MKNADVRDVCKISLGDWLSLVINTIADCDRPMQAVTATCDIIQSYKVREDLGSQGQFHGGKKKFDMDQELGYPMDLFVHAVDPNYVCPIW